MIETLIGTWDAVSGGSPARIALLKAGALQALEASHEASHAAKEEPAC